MIAILGGTFDPVHLGHISIANQVRQQLGLEQLQLMPCAQPVHRQPAFATASNRLAMLRLALAEHTGLQVNEIELQRGGKSYMVDSLQQLREQTSEPLALVIGADAFNHFNSWRQPEQILALANLVVCCRPGVHIAADLFADARVDSVEQLLAAPHGKIHVITVNENPCSSTAVRTAIAQGGAPADCLPSSVLHYISEHNLYRSHGA